MPGTTEGSGAGKEVGDHHAIVVPGQLVPNRLQGRELAEGFPSSSATVGNSIGTSTLMIPKTFLP